MKNKKHFLDYANSPKKKKKRKRKVVVTAKGKTLGGNKAVLIGLKKGF